jgi:Domain of unknown function (DUF4865)
MWENYMLAMQYSVRLTNDFDLGKVYERVAKRGPMFEGHPGLKHKFYLYDEEAHIYAPMYIWEDNQSAQSFLMENLFADVVQDFGRPRVRSWQILEFNYGSSDVDAVSMLAEVDKVCDRHSLSDVQSHERNIHQKMVSEPGLFANLVLLDPDRWEISRCSLWSKKNHVYRATSDCVYEYDVVPQTQLTAGAA